MKYRFETEDDFEAKCIIESGNNQRFLWELKHNFHRQFEIGNHQEVKNVDTNSFYAGVNFVLDELSEFLMDFNSAG